MYFERRFVNVWPLHHFVQSKLKPVFPTLPSAGFSPAVIHIQALLLNSHRGTSGN